MIFMMTLVIINIMACQEEAVLKEENLETRIIQERGQAVEDLNLLSQGKVAGDIQLGFLPPEDYKEVPENFQGWLLVYDQKPFDQVWDQLSGMTLEALKKLSDLEGANQGYFIDKYDYADGLGNTLNPGQKTLSDGKDLNLGKYYFYVATVTSEGLVGLVEAREMIDIKPVAKNIGFIEDQEGYKVTFDPMVDESLQGHFLCLSQASLYDFKSNISTMTKAEILDYAKDKKGIFLDLGVKEAYIKKDMMTFEGQDSQKGIFNLYVVSVGQEGFLDVGRSVDFIIHEQALKNQAETIHEGMGTVMLIGGGTASSDEKHEDLFSAMLEAAGGKRPRLAILSSSRMDAMTVYDHFYFKDPEFGSFEDNYHDLGFEPVFIPLAIDNGYRIKNDSYWVSVLASCQGAYLQGGDQYKHVKSLLNEEGSPSLMLKALQGILDRGGLVAGTSAGMAAMGDYAYGYGYSPEALTHNQTEMMTVKDIPLQGSLVSNLLDNNITTPGIGLIRDDILVDSHFDRRGRLGRLLVAMRDTEKTIGIGVDEGTALSIQNEVGTVIGHQGVFILDGSETVYGQRGPDHVFLAENIKLHYLTAGDRYDFWSKNALQSKDKIALEGLDGFSSTSQIFSDDYGTTKVLLDFMQSDETLLEIPYKLLNGKVVTLAFEKTDKTKAYTSSSKYEDPSLEGYYQSSIENLMVSVYENKDKDSLPPQISYMTSYTKAYKVYLGITDNLSGIDEASINGETVTFTSEKNSLYRPPFYDTEYEEIAIVIAEDAFAKGDQVHVNGVKDLEGNPVEEQTWEFDGLNWFKK
jgi:cyanophycinase